MCFPKKIVSYLFALLFLLPVEAFSDEGVLFSSFFAEKNLSSLSITCFLQDSRGFMWIGTHDGLNYFNGKTVRIFKHDYQDKNSLPDNQVNSIGEDGEGNIWIGTSWGISRLDPSLLTFRNFAVDKIGEGLGYKVKVYVDRENNTWAFAGDLFLFNKATGQFEKKTFGTPAGFLNIKAPKLYNTVFEDSQKRYWIATSNNVYRYFPAQGKFIPLDIGNKKIFFMNLSEDQEGKVLCGSWNDGLFRIDGASNSLTRIAHQGLICCSATQQFIDGTRTWIGNALASFDATTNNFRYYRNDATNPYSARPDDVAALLVDNQNQLWIGYASKGIQIVSPGNQVFKTFRISERENMFPNVNCFIHTRRGYYAGGWYNYSLVKLDKDFKPLKTWKTLVPQMGIAENNLSDAWADGKGNIWFSSCFGLIRFNEETEKTALFRMDSSLSKNNHFLQLLPEGDSVLWIGGYFSGLSRFSMKSKTFRNWGARQRVLYWSITRDNTGMIWLANNSGCLTGFDPRTETFKDRYYKDLTENSIYSHIIFDSLGQALWIATTNGLLKVNRKTFEGKLFTEKDNLPTSQINSLQFDPHHRLWIATNKGLCFYDPAQNIFKAFFSNNGLPHNVLSQLFQMQSNGELFIGYKDGFSVLQTNTIPAESFEHSVMIDKIYESEKIVPVKLSGNRKTVELNYDEDNIRIEFSSNDLINSEDNQLLFKLEGFDNKWYVAQNGVVNYSNLAPGKYLFHAGGINHAGVRSQRDDYLAIIIYPPLWKKTWFLLVIALFLFGLTVIAARYVFTRNFREKILILEKEQAVEKERTRISQDMHDELGSGLTKISIMSEVAMKQLENSNKAKSQLETISFSSRELVDNLQDIIWILNSKNDSLENLCAYLQEYALKYFEPFDIVVRVNFPEHIPQMPLSEDQRRSILLVFKESFNNITKHSACTELQLSLLILGKKVSFMLTDNGKGFDKEAIRNFANGLLNMKKRMQSIQGSFEIHSALQKGTTSEFSFEA